MPKQIINPKECLLYASILEKGHIKISQIKHPKHYRGEYEKIQDAFLLDPEFNFFRVRSEVLFMRERANCLLFLYKCADYYYTCIGTKNYRKRIAQNFLEELAEEHQKVLVASGPMQGGTGQNTTEGGSGGQLTALQKIETKKLLKQKFDHHNQPFNDVYLQGMKLVDENIDGVRLSLEKAALRAGQINELNEKSSRILDSTYTANDKSKRLKNTAAGNVYKFACIGFVCVGAMVSVTLFAVLFKFHIFDRLIPGQSPANPVIPMATTQSNATSSAGGSSQIAAAFFPQESAAVTLGDFATEIDEDAFFAGDSVERQKIATNIITGVSRGPLGTSNKLHRSLTREDESLMNGFEELDTFIQEAEEHEAYLDSLSS